MSSDDFADGVQKAVGSRYLLEPGPDGRQASRPPWSLFLATERESGRRVAIKALATGGLDPVVPLRFEREVGSVESLPGWLGLPDFGRGGILSIASRGHAEGVLYYVTPWLSEGSLRARLDRDGRLPTAEAVRVLGEVAEAVGFLHQRGFVHRSLKPENVLFDGGHAVLAESFGHLIVPRLALEPGFEPDYESPEVLRGSLPDPCSNVHSLATLGFEMLAGRRPFVGTPIQVAVAIASGAPPTPLSSLCPEAPRGLVEVLGKASAALPEDRFPDALVFREALVAAVAR